MFDTLRQISTKNLLTNILKDKPLKLLNDDSNTINEKGALALNAAINEYALMPVNLNALSDDKMSDGLINSMPDALYLALFERFITPYISKLSDLFDVRITITDYLTKEDVESYTAGSFTFSISTDDGKTLCFKVFAKTDAAFEKARTTLLDKFALKKQTLDINDNVYLSAGTSLVTVEELKSIEIGDAIFLDAFYPQQKLLKIFYQNKAAFADIDSDFKVLTLKDSLKNDIGLNEMSDIENSNSQSDMQETTDINSLKLNVELVIDKKQMSIEEISALTQGSTIEISPDTLNSICLCINGSCFAKGRIVQTQDNIAVEIVELYKKD